jgi:hypothetical protein
MGARSLALVLAAVASTVADTGAGSRAGADDVSTEARAAVRRFVDVPIFAIRKSENRNEVQYVVRVDESCSPLGDAPAWAYWRMLEVGPTRTEWLLPRELSAYGLAGQWVRERGRVGLVLRAVPSRPIVVETSRGTDGQCRAVATATIAGAPARLYGVFVMLRWPVGVDYLLLQGWSLDGAHAVSERLRE